MKASGLDFSLQGDSSLLTHFLFIISSESQFFLESQLITCIFLEIYLSYLLCWHNVVRDIPYSSFSVGSSAHSFFQTLVIHMKEAIHTKH